MRLKKSKKKKWSCEVFDQSFVAEWNQWIARHDKFDWAAQTKNKLFLGNFFRVYDSVW